MLYWSRYTDYMWHDIQTEHDDRQVLPLTKVLMNGLKTRFMDIMSSDDYNIATMLVPQFRLNYLEQSQRSIKRALLVEAVKKWRFLKLSQLLCKLLQLH